MTTALPKNLTVDYTQSFTMKYTLDQTYNEYQNPNNYFDSRTNFYYNITFDTGYNWIATVFYNAKFRRGCGEDNRKYLNADFKYRFSNVTREIDLVYYSYSNWPLLNKHPSYYIGRNPADKEYVLIDELRLLLGGDGMTQQLFDNISIESISISGNTYETRKYSFIATLGDYFV